MTAYGMAATVDFGLDAKQGLLDLRSENARLRLVTRLFRAATSAWTSSSARRRARARTGRSASAEIRAGPHGQPRAGEDEHEPGDGARR